jgi:hypothetical protein
MKKTLEQLKKEWEDARQLHEERSYACEVADAKELDAFHACKSTFAAYTKALKEEEG